MSLDWKAPVNGARRLWNNSGFCAVLDRVGTGGGRLLRESFLWQVFRQDGILAEDWQDSRLCMVLDGAVNLPGTLCAALRRKMPGLFENSLFLRLLTALGDRSGLLTGLLLLVMLVAPHAMWNNLYTLLGVLAILLINAVSRRSERTRLDVKAPGPWIALFLIGILRAMAMVEPLRLSLRFCLFHLSGMLIMLLIVSTVDDYKKLKRLLWTVFVGITVASVYGCYQSAVGVELKANQQDMVLNAGMPGRIYSFFDNPNNYAELIVMTVPMGIALILNADSPQERRLAVLCMLPCIASLGFTYSRSGWIGFVLAVMVFCLLYRWKLAPVFVVLGLCCLPLLPGTILRRIMTIGNKSDSSSRYRVMIYESSWRMIRDHWLGGIGLGTDILYQTFKQYPTMADGNWPIHCHNNYLEIWAEMGLFGIVPFLGMALHSFRSGVTQVFRADKRLRAVLAAAIGSFAGILLIACVEYTWFYPRDMFFFWFTFGVVTVSVKLIRKGKTA